MENLVQIQYGQTGVSATTDALGMREMQRIVYAARSRQYLLVKAPPASGKSRALMFVALDKLANQGIKRVIVAVPEKTIARSFKDTELVPYGFFADWKVSEGYNLCTPGLKESGLRQKFIGFLSSDATVLVCTHSTFRNALKDLDITLLNDTFIGIDEFHHTSADELNNLGTAIRAIIGSTNAHIMAMTGSYFRGDAVPVMRPEDEAKFQPTITYNYYQQLNGYKYLKSLGIGYQFYQGKYISAIPLTLDTHKKTLIHIPNVNSRSSYTRKYDQVADIISCIGTVVGEDAEHYIKMVKTPDGRILKVGDLVEDDSRQRDALQAYLNRMDSADALDILIALGTAKEGFDWQWCECCLTIGIRASLTEVIQIIGRCTRDCEGKTHAQFTNLIPCPSAAEDDVKNAVNDMLKAITASLLMEQVMQPEWKFRTAPEKDTDDDSDRDESDKRTIRVKGLKKATDRVQAIVENDLTELKATLYSSDIIKQALAGNQIAEVITQSLIPKIIEERYPELTPEEQEQLRQHLVLSTTLQGAEVVTHEDGSKFLKVAGQFINLDDLSINLIDSINPFQRAYEILSKSLTPEILRTIQDTIDSQREEMTKEEAILLYKKYLPKYKEEHGGALPTVHDPDPTAKRIAVAIAFLRKLKQQSLTAK